MNIAPNNAINMDSEKRRAFIAPLFTAGYGKRYAAQARATGNSGNDV
ncbi:MAG TPA: hypothetical protein VFV61_02310 [Pyrinomonadaceae bacterium]|nr:hypothetical protein [Pyrinomonadaceae bacterium]